MTNLELWELASYIVTVFGLPFALYVFYLEQRRERQTEEEEIYQRLSDEYADFSKLLLENADLHLSPSSKVKTDLSPEQTERRKIIFEILIALFERAFILVYEEDMSKQTQRLWASWDDYFRAWIRRSDFREMLPELLSGEDQDFQNYLMRIAKEV